MADGVADSDSIRLNRRGRAVLLSGVALLFIATTAGAPFIAASGASLIALCVWSLAAARVTRRALDALELTWAQEALPMRPCGEAVTLTLRLRTGQGRPLRSLVLEPMVSGPALLPVSALHLDAPPSAEAALELPLSPPRAGLWRVWGLRLTAEDALGLTTQVRWQPLPVFLHVGPRPVPRALGVALLRRITAARDREGRQLDRQSGSGLELRELRDYVPGDPLKAIAWKASGRRQRWLVRAFEDESMRRFQVLLDIGPAMRSGRPGEAPLDRAIDLAALLLSFSAAERVGLTTFDHRVVAHLRPETGRAHGQRLLQQLLDVTRVVDEDLTDTCDAELFARIGALLEAQEGLSLRRLPHDLSRIAQTEILVDPIRELYDESAIFTHVSQVIAQDRDRGHALLHGKARPAAELASARLRLFCALNALPLPYRFATGAESAEQGLAAALRRNLLAGGPQTMVLLADLSGLSPGGLALRTMGLCRAHKRQIVAVALGAPPGSGLRQAMLAAGVRLVDVAPAERAAAGPA